MDGGEGKRKSKLSRAAPGHLQVNKSCNKMGGGDGGVASDSKFLTHHLARTVQGSPHGGRCRAARRPWGKGGGAGGAALPSPSGAELNDS